CCAVPRALPPSPTRRSSDLKDPKRIPGLAALLTCVLLLLTYVSVTVAAMMYAGLGETGTGLSNEANADDVFLAIKDGLLGPVGRSEEHTSELQSRENLVCRL